MITGDRPVEWSGPFVRERSRERTMTGRRLWRRSVRVGDGTARVFAAGGNDANWYKSCPGARGERSVMALSVWNGRGGSRQRA
ncbi:unnamed protein product [Lampetra planeri]